jgi:Secretion system C-terminal sorting domain/Carbohydrate-binding module 48 (Isoamylase N-terminal domain)
MYKKIVLLLSLVLAFQSLLAFSVTFKVDMSNVVSYTTPELNGNFNNWCGNCAQMTDADGDDIWEVTVQLNAGSYQYKYSYDNWSGSELLTPGSSCTQTTGEFTNRIVQVSGTLVLPVVCWSSCLQCALPTPVQVVFNLDAASQMPENASLSGNFNDYCANCETMSALGNGIFSDTLMLLPGVYQYYYRLNNGTVSEQLEDANCMVVNNNDNVHRITVVTEATTLPQVCWQSCQGCGVNVQNDIVTAWNIYPNPANNHINVVMNNERGAEVKIYNTTGEMVMTEKWANDAQGTLDISHLTAGVYSMQMTSERYYAVKKIIVER